MRCLVEANQGLSMTSSGEGGPLRLAPEGMRWQSLQAASAHFGITAADLRQVRDVEIKINQEVVDPEDVEMLEDLVLAAIQQAREKAQQLAEEEMQKATAGMLPPGMGLPGLG